MLHYVFNRQGNLIKFYPEKLAPEHKLVFLHSRLQETLATFDNIPIEYRYVYDQEGRIIEMYEITAGKEKLLFTRKYIPR